MSNGKSERFGMVMEPVDRHALDFIVRRERISAAAVVRRLLWREAQKMGCEFLNAPHEGESAMPEVMTNALG